MRWDVYGRQDSYHWLHWCGAVMNVSYKYALEFCIEADANPEFWDETYIVPHGEKPPKEE